MRKLLFALAFCFAASPALAQNTTCSDRPQSDSSNACANTRFAHGAAAKFAPGGANGSIQYNNSGVFGGYPPSGNGTTIPTTTGTLTTGHCVTLDASLNFVDSGAPCIGGFANPTALVGPTAINGVATTVMRSDSAPAINQSATYAWTGPHSWTESTQKWNISSSGISGGPKFNNIRFASQYGQADWCANLIAAIADLGTNPGTILIDSAAGPSACSAVSTINVGNYHKIQFVDGNIYVLNQTMQFGLGDSISGIGGGNFNNPPLTQGTVLKWTGGTGTDMLLFYGASFSHLHDIGLDCNNTASCVGIQIDSNNSPPSTRNVFERFEITGYHIGFSIGSLATSAVSGASCTSNMSQSGCSENDQVEIHSFQLFANCGDTTAEGFRINSLNAIQNSLIANGNIQCGNIAVNIINMNDSARFERITFGSVQGTSPTQFLIGSGVINGPDLFDNETEGAGLTYAVHNSAAGGADAYVGNQWNNPILIDGAARVTSMSNTGGSTWTVAGTAHVVSIGDITTTKWTASGSGTVTVVGN